jgi:type VI secretion system protein ImpL
MSHGDQLKSMLGFSALTSLYGIAGLLVWFGGSYLGLGATERVVLIALILLTWPFAILIAYYRKKKQEQKAALPAPGQGPAPPSAQPGTKLAAPARAYEELTRGAEEAVQWLRSTRLGGAKASDAAYALPWFIVAGPSASGKTSLVLASGLSFHALPSQRQAEQNLIRPTRGCDWRVTDAAILIDTAGRYQSDGQDRDEWAALIETLKKYRAARPVDGLLVVVNAEQILRASDMEIEQQAKVLRARLDEAMQRAGNRFPVYLIFTHLDRVEGFSDFFRTLKPEERGQVWGATIPLDQTAGAHALFDPEFDLLFDTLMRRRLRRLSVIEPPDKQIRLFNFPLQFGDTRAKLGMFTSILFRPNPFSESPMLRGFYFVGHGTNGAVPARAADDGAAQAAGESRFTEKFFKEVLLSDRNLAAAFQAQKRRPPLGRYVLIGSAALLIAALLTGLVVSFVTNNRLIERATEKAIAVRNINQADGDRDVSLKSEVQTRDELRAVEELRKVLAELDEYERGARPLYLRFGLYSGHDIYENARVIYFTSVNKRFAKRMFIDIENDLKRFADGQVAMVSAGAPGAASQPNQETLGKYYDLLKAYFMLSNIEKEKIDPFFLYGQLEPYWKKFATAQTQGEALEQLKFYTRQLSYGLTGKGDPSTLKVNEDLVVRVGNKLKAYPAADRYYKRVINETNQKTQSIDVDAILKGKDTGIVTGTYAVPGSFTVEGYQQHMIEAFEKAPQAIKEEDWVMVKAKARSETTNESVDVEALKRRYFREYIDEWQKFMNGLSVREFKKDDAVETLRTLRKPDSPLVRIMEEIVRQTRLSAAPASGGIIGWIKGLFSSSKPAETGGTEVEQAFRPLHNFFPKEGENRPVDKYLGAIDAVIDPLDEVLKSGTLSDVSKEMLAGKDTKIKLGRAEQEVAKSLESFNTVATRTAASVLKQPLANLRLMIVGVGPQIIEQAWQTEVLPAAQKLETSGFPFTDTGQVSLKDLTEFLNPVNGQFTDFYKKNLAALFDDVPGQPLKLKDSSPIKSFSKEFLDYLNNARALRQALFANNTAQQPAVEYSLTVEQPPGVDVRFEIDGQTVQGPGEIKLSWPARAGQQTGVTITATPNAGALSGTAGAIVGGAPATPAITQAPPPLQFQGEWGLFQMIRDGGGDAAKTADGQYELKWKLGAPPNQVEVRARLRPASAANNPFQRSLFTNLRAPKSTQN